MKIRSSFVSNSSSSSFIMVGGYIDYEGEVLSFDDFCGDYLHSCLFGNWFEYYLEHEGRDPIKNFVNDDVFVSNFLLKVKTLPAQCEEDYIKLKKLIKEKRNKLKTHDEDAFRKHILDIDRYENKIVEYCKKLLEPSFKDKIIILYIGDDHSSIGDMDEESYIRDLFYSTDCFYKIEFNNH